MHDLDLGSLVVGIVLVLISLFAAVRLLPLLVYVLWNVFTNGLVLWLIVVILTAMIRRLLG